MYPDLLKNLTNHPTVKMLASKVHDWMRRVNLTPKQFCIIGSMIGGVCFSGLLLVILFVAVALSAGGSAQPVYQPTFQHAPMHPMHVPARQDNFWSTQHSAGNCNANNTQGYVNVPGHGVIGYGF